MDYLATSVKVPFGIHGYGAFFATGILDRFYRPDMSLQEGIELLKRCINEVQKRLVINLPAFKLTVIDKDGIHDLPDIIINANDIGLRPTPSQAPTTSVTA